MKKISILWLMLCMVLTVQAQYQNFGNQNQFSNNFESNPERARQRELDSLSHSHVDGNTVPHSVRAWKIDPRFGNIIPTDVDTLFLNFQNSNETYGMNGEYNMLGIMGSPRQSRIFMNRQPMSESFFLDPYDFFLRTPQNQLFYNTKSPFTNLSYWSCGDKTVGDDRFKALFSVNGNKRLNLGFVVDYLYGRGYYQYQATSYFNTALYGSYVGERYNLHALLSHNHMKASENGGIENDLFITDPDAVASGVTSNTIPVVLNQTWNRNDNLTFYLTHRYNVGFHRLTTDSVREFVPVTSFIHTLEVGGNDHKFLAYATPEKYYLNKYLPSDSTRDETQYRTLKNTLAIQLKEGFNKWAQAGLTGFIRTNVRNYKMLDRNEDKLMRMGNHTEMLTTVGGVLSREQGTHIHYNVLGETTLTGSDAGDFNIDGTLNLNFKLLSDTINLTAHAYFKNQTPNYFMRHYHSHHFWWDNDLSKEFRSRIEGTLDLKRTRTTLRVSVENIKNYTYLRNRSQAYLNDKGEVAGWSNAVDVAQESENLQVLTAQLKQKFKLGILNWDNELTYQTTSHENVLPLPKLNVYSNLYLKFHLVKNVLQLQIGGDVRYFTSYYASDYCPGLGQFIVQNPENKVKIGNYPIVNTYINAEWKRCRIYLQLFSHVNDGMGNRRSFLAPHYPINPQAFKMGISWSFYD